MRYHAEDGPQVIAEPAKAECSLVNGRIVSHEKYGWLPRNMLWRYRNLPRACQSKHAVVQADPLAGRAVALLAHHAQLADGGTASGFRDHAFR